MTSPTFYKKATAFIYGLCEGLTRENVDKLYLILGEELKKISLNPERIYTL